MKESMRLQIDIRDKNNKHKVYEREYKSHKIYADKDRLYVVVTMYGDVEVTFCFGLGLQKKMEIKKIFKEEFENAKSERMIKILLDIARMKIRIGKCTRDLVGVLVNYDSLEDFLT